MRGCLLRPLGVLVAVCAGLSAALGTDANAASEPAAAARVAANEPLRFEFLSVPRAIVQVEQGAVQVIDARGAMKYIAGHVPGAISIRDEQLRQHVGGLPTQMLSGAEMGALFGRAGVDAARPVLVYADSDDALCASVVAYGLVKAGHRHVSVLNGGFAAWQGAGPMTQDLTTVTASEWTASADDSVLATLDDVRLVLKRDEAALVDARPAKFYRGETKAWKRNGHIPGATNLDWHGLVQSDNESALKSAAELSKAIEASGLDANDDTIVYCGTGREATMLYLYLKGTLKWERVRLYEGSWTEYSADATLPVATGSEARPLVGSDGEVSISGQPTADMLREMADRGYNMVINCRTAGEMRGVGFDERSLVESLGMTYVQVPLGGSDGYAPEDVAKLDEALREHVKQRVDATAEAAKARGATGASKPDVYMHCAGGGRSATLWAAYLVKHRGVTPSDAMERMRAMGVLHETSIERLLNEKLMLSKPD